jgi:hypothetical protein
LAAAPTGTKDIPPFASHGESRDWHGEVSRSKNRALSAWYLAARRLLFERRIRTTPTVVRLFARAIAIFGGAYSKALHSLEIGHAWRSKLWLALYT